MQIFLPYPSFEDSVHSLDNRRLFKQLLEARQILKAIENKGGPWFNHCVTRTWLHWPKALRSYLALCNNECLRRGIGKITTSMPITTCVTVPFSVPEDYFIRYQQHLLAKDFEFYSKVFPSLEPKAGYYAKNKQGAWQLYSVSN